MPQQTKLPPRLVKSDGFSVKQGGKTFYPHAGERIELDAAGTIGEVVVALRFQEVQNISELGADEGAEVRTALETLLGDIASAITFWNWTDNNKRPYENPPTPETLRRLSVDELGYLVTILISGTADAAKNGSSPSTSRSTGSRARSRRRTG